jgi:hypothetical protein
MNNAIKFLERSYQPGCYKEERNYVDRQFSCPIRLTEIIRPQA